MNKPRLYSLAHHAAFFIAVFINITYTDPIASVDNFLLFMVFPMSLVLFRKFLNDEYITDLEYISFAVFCANVFFFNPKFSFTFICLIIEGFVFALFSSKHKLM